MARFVGAGNAYPAPEWRNCCWPSCDHLAEGGGPPLCEKHYSRVGMAWVSEHGLGNPFARFPKAPPGGITLDQHLADRDAAMKAQTQVYYVRTGDHVKIGFTINLRQRLGALRLDDDALLATEPGGRQLEAERHKQFAEERVGKRENFNPSRRLLAHIEAVIAEHGPPKITDYRTRIA